MRTATLALISRLVLSTVYALLIVLVPWDQIRGSYFRDIENYLYRINQIQLHTLDYFFFGEGALSYLRSEYLWSWLLAALVQRGFEGEHILSIVSAAAAFIAHWFLARYVGSVWALVILLNPISIDLYASQIRSALAFSLFLVAVQLGGSSVRNLLSYALLATAPFIHTSMLIVGSLYLTAKFYVARFRLRSSQMVLVTLIGSCVLAVLLAEFAQLAASYAGDRRSLSSEGTGTRSLAYNFFWFIFPMVLAAGYTVFNTRQWAYHFGIAICLITAASELLGLPFFRFIALAIPVTMAIIPTLKRRFRLVAIALMVLYDLILFSYWLRG
jgi:hypothetical protein